MSVWNGWLPRPDLEVLVAKAKARLHAVANIWRHVRGPGAAAVATCARLNWVVVDAATMITDAGRTLHLDLDPPAVIRKEVRAAVHRWRWRRLEHQFPQLNRRSYSEEASGVGGEMTSIWRALNGRPGPNWGAGERAAFKSVFANRQWPQARCHAAGFTKHDRCVACYAQRCRRA